MLSFRNQVVLIIGASRGVGAATAVKFAEAAVEGTVISFTKSFAAEWGHFNVRINCVALGWLG